jgi:ribosomal protein L7/L12
MSVEESINQLQARIMQLEDRIKFLYKCLNIRYLEDPNLADAKVVEILQRGNKIEAIKIFREMYNVGLAEAKNAVEEIAAQHGL